MKRRTFLSQIGLAGSGILASMINTNSLLAKNNSNRQKPNIIFIFADDLGWGDLPVYGYNKISHPAGWQVRGDLKMPNLERLAKEGTLFTQFYVAAPTCTPSRVGILSGQYPSKLKMYAPIIQQLHYNESRGIPNYMDYTVPTVMKSLKQNGYKIGHFGKWHIGINKDGSAPFPERYGVDEYKDCRDGINGRNGSTELIADNTIEFIQKHKNEPFYVNTWLYDPHSPLNPSVDEMKDYQSLSQESKFTGALQIWYTVLSRIDKHVGRILNALDASGLSNNTIVIFSSDNGAESGQMPHTSHFASASSVESGPFRGIKRSLYEGGIREPFIVKWPGKVAAGKVDSTSVFTAVDYFPSICAVTGSEIYNRECLDGEDLSNIFYGKTVERKNPIMWEVREPVYGRELDKSPRCAIRDKNWKLLMNPDRSRIELYNIINDPGEVDNRANEYPGVVKDLSNILIKWLNTLPQSPVHPDAGKINYPWPK